MHPVICHIGPLTIYSYGVMLAVAVLVCTSLLSRDAAREGIASETIFDLVFWVVLSGIAGARLFYILLTLDFYKAYPAEAVMIWHGGLAWQGALFGGLLAAWIFFRRNKLPMLKMMDLAVPYAALGQAIGRVGCFLNGCCYGKPVAWGVYLPAQHEHVYPSQLFECVLLLIVFAVLKILQRRPHRTGEILVMYLLLSSPVRFVVQFFRYDNDPLLWGLSVFQIVCVVVFAAAWYLLWRLKQVRS